VGQLGAMRAIGDLEVTLFDDRVAIAGEIDMANAEAFGDLLMASTKPGCSHRIDLSGITFISAAGVHQIIRAAREPGGEGLVLVSPSPLVRRVLALTLVERVSGLSVVP